jgi:hypothetical protein
MLLQLCASIWKFYGHQIKGAHICNRHTYAMSIHCYYITSEFLIMNLPMQQFTFDSIDETL